MGHYRAGPLNPIGCGPDRYDWLSSRQGVSCDRHDRFRPRVADQCRFDGGSMPRLSSQQECRVGCRERPHGCIADRASDPPNAVADQHVARYAGVVLVDEDRTPGCTVVREFVLEHAREACPHSMP